MSLQNLFGEDIALNSTLEEILSAVRENSASTIGKPVVEYNKQTLSVTDGTFEMVRYLSTAKEKIKMVIVSGEGNAMVDLFIGIIPIWTGFLTRSNSQIILPLGIDVDINEEVKLVVSPSIDQNSTFTTTLIHG